jgi:transposase
VSKTFRPWEPRQTYLLPPSPRDWLPKDHLAYFILDLVESLDLSPIFAHYERELRGYPPHHPQMMVALLLYAYCVGVPSSRKIERRTHEDVAFRVITADQHPDHVRISEFRRIHLRALAELFVQVLKLCQRAGLVKLGVVALDGTKIKANASKHKAMSYDRMKKDEVKLRAQIAELLQQAEAADADEDARYGKDRRGDELPEDLRRAESRLARIMQLKAELEAEARSAQEREAEAKRNGDDDPPGAGGSAPLPEHRVPTEKDGTPTDKAQRNFTDADSRIMKTGDGYVQGYNCQAVVDAEHQVIVAQAVTNQPPDPEHWQPMMERTIANCEKTPNAGLADSGYCSEENIVYALNQAIDPYLATGRDKHGEPPPSVRGRPPRSLTLRAEMRRKLATKHGRRMYSRRKVIVEPVFGQIKEARGFRRFLLRGLQKVNGEWSLITMTHNLLKLFAAAQPV